MNDEKIREFIEILDSMVKQSSFNGYGIPTNITSFATRWLKENTKNNNEDLQKLEVIGKEMNKQDCRVTQWPLFVIQVDKKVYVSSDMDYDDWERKPSDCFKLDDMCQKCKDSYDETGVIPDKCLYKPTPEDPVSFGKCPDDMFAYYKVEQDFDLNAGVFLTAKACEEHIRLNHYHYSNPQSYAIGSWRNYEMQTVLNFLSKLGSDNGKALSQYQ